MLGAPKVHLGHPVLPISPTGPPGAHNPLAHSVNPAATAITPNPWAPQAQHASHIFVGPPPGAAPPAPPLIANPDAALDKHVAIAAVALKDPEKRPRPDQPVFASSAAAVTASTWMSAALNAVRS